MSEQANEEFMDAKEFQELRADVELIKRAVVGEPKAGQPGLVKRVERLERGYGKLMLKVAATIGGLGGAGFGVVRWLEHAVK